MNENELGKIKLTVYNIYTNVIRSFRLNVVKYVDHFVIPYSKDYVDIQPRRSKLSITSAQSSIVNNQPQALKQKGHDTGLMTVYHLR